MMNNILITGGTGTLGHAITSRLYDQAGAGITIYSRSELKQAQMKAKYPRCRYILGDVRDYVTLAAAIAGHDTVIHAAAMKRIPECEAQPGLCHEINVIGSEYVARACVAHNVERCIGISTDKACMPVTVYGASKLLMERLFQSQEGDTKFVLVRYGNVLESNGSVIPLWRAQAAAGGPLGITDMRMTRFWMAPRDAAACIIQALHFNHGLMLVPKLKSLPISSMAQWVAPGVVVQVIGRRSSERTHEFLISPDEAADDEYTGGDGFVIDHSGEAAGITYSSETAPQLTRDEFDSMLAEVNLL